MGTEDIIKMIKQSTAIKSLYSLNEAFYKKINKQYITVIINKFEADNYHNECYQLFNGMSDKYDISFVEHEDLSPLSLELLQRNGRLLWGEDLDTKNSREPNYTYSLEMIKNILVDYKNNLYKLIYSKNYSNVQLNKIFELNVNVLNYIELIAVLKKDNFDEIKEKSIEILEEIEISLKSFSSYECISYLKRTLKNILLLEKRYNQNSQKVLNVSKAGEINLYNSTVKAIVSKEDSIELSKRGYRLLSDYKCYRPPYIKIMDLSNLDDIWLNLNLEQVLDIFSEIKRSVERKCIENNEYRAVNWNTNNSCLIDLMGPSTSSLEKLKEKFIVESFKKITRTSPNNYVRNSSIELKGDLLNLLKSVQDDYESYIDKAYKSQIKLYNLSYIPKYAFWNEVKSLSENKIFIGLGGIPLWLSYMSEDINDTSTTIVEYHLGGDPYRPYRKGNLIFDNQSILLRGKSLEECKDDCLIIDQAYSGKTLKVLKGMMGSKAKVLSFYPKSWEAIEVSDYLVFNDRLFKKDNLNLDRENWYRQLLTLSLEKKEERVLII